MKKLLIVPSKRLVQPESRRSFKTVLKQSKIYRYLFDPFLAYDGELMFYGDIPKILGESNVFVYGKYYPHLFEKRVPKFCPYPSCHATPKSVEVDSSNVEEIVSQVDALLVSTRAGPEGEFIRSLARKKEIPIALFDFLDQESNYGDDNISDKICYDFKLGLDFDLYFKKDLPLGYATDIILPVAPVPVRPESYVFKDLHKEFSVFYSGRGRQDACQNDRYQSVELISDKIADSKIIDHSDRGSFLTTTEYWNYISSSKLCLSPSGRVWDSFRHAEIGLSKSTVMIAPKPYVHTVGPELIDGHNSILYETYLQDGKYNLDDESKLIDKIQFYLLEDSERLKVSNQWSTDVASGHTVFARSKYIIDSMKSFFYNK